MEFQVYISDPNFDNERNPYVQFTLMQYTNVEGNDYDDQIIDGFRTIDIPFQICDSF